MVDVRQVRPDEWRAVKDVRLAMLRDTPTAFITTIDEELVHGDQVWRDRAIAGSLGQEQITILAFNSDAPIGMAVGLRKVRFEKPTLAVVSVFIVAAFRGAGIADEMLRQVEGWGSSWGATCSILWVEDGGKRAAGFYTKAGYSMTLDRAKFPNDSELWGSRMEKSLERET